MTKSSAKGTVKDQINYYALHSLLLLPCAEPLREVDIETTTFLAINPDRVAQTKSWLSCSSTEYVDSCQPTLTTVSAKPVSHKNNMQGM